MSKKKKKRNYLQGYQVRPFMKDFGYTIIETKSVEEGIAFIRSIPSKKSFSRKHILAELADNNPECVCCKRVGTKFCLGQGKLANVKSANRGEDLHWDLYTEDGVAMSIDHIVPRSKGGADHISNTQLMCIECNNIKGNKPNRLIAYKHIIDAGISVVAMQKAGMAFLVINDYQQLPTEGLEELKEYLIEDVIEFDGKFVYYFNDKPAECLVESE